jgi:YVTN family beta-propeller protein
MMRTLLRIGILLVVIVPPSQATKATRTAALPGLRRPVALALTPDGRWLFTANQQAGTVSVIETATRNIAAEVLIGRRLSDLILLPDARRLLAVDEATDELIVVTAELPRLTVRCRLKISPDPVSVRVAPDGRHCFVASLWSHRLDVIDVARERPRVARTVRLPFAPRQQLVLRDPLKLLVADAFGGRLAVVDPATGAVESVRELPAHNIRGLALSGDGKQLWLTHQTLNRLAETTQDDIHWGSLMTNDLRSVPLADLLRPKADLLATGRLLHLGDVGRGAADPAGLAFGRGGQAVIALAGVDEVQVGGEKDGTGRRVRAGACPTAVALSPDGRHAYVANTLGDSVAVVNVAAGKVEAEVALGPMGELRPRDRGERLFHSARLTHDGWFSCQSCHTDGHSNGRLADTLGDGTYGTPKRVLSLRGVKDTGPWAWNGSMPDLATQVRHSVQKTMHGRNPTATQVTDLIAYLESLPPAPPLGRFDARQDGPAVKRGGAVFTKQGCDRCHAPPTYTSRKTFDVGWADEAGARQFNPPSLRGVSQGGPYFHDGRAPTLDAVFTRYRHKLEGSLTDGERRDLLAFLRSI